MKKSTIWVIAGVMGISFLTLLVLQTKYLEEVIHMRREQVSESVTRSLHRLSRTLELAETRTGLEELFDQAQAASPRSQALSEDSSLESEASEAQAPAEATSQADQEAALHISLPSSKSNALFLPHLAHNELTESTRDSIRRHYLNDPTTLEEMVLSLLYKASDKPLAERIDFRSLDSHLRAILKSEGIDLDYHFYVTTSDGREVYRCSDYTPQGSKTTYKQVLFPNDPASRTGIIYVHFPQIDQYIYTSVRFIIPAIVFTLVLLLIFIFTIYTIFRQKKVSEMKNDFINNMTHEFKTPISSISLAAQMLKDPSVVKNEKVFKNIAGVIFDETKRLRFQVEKVLQMSLFDKQASTFKRKEVDANLLVKETVNTFRLKVETSGGTIDTQIEAEDSIIFVDEMHLTNVIFNLMDNAVKYKAPERNLCLHISTRNESNRFILTVSDNGIGIRKEDLKKIFEKFYRVHTGNRHDVKGFGLGLAYVQNIVNSLGGNIHAESEFGKGTKFIIAMPLMK